MGINEEGEIMNEQHERSKREKGKKEKGRGAKLKGKRPRLTAGALTFIYICIYTQLKRKKKKDIEWEAEERK